MSRIQITDNKTGKSGWDYSFWGYINENDLREIEKALEEIKEILLDKDDKLT